MRRSLLALGALACACAPARAAPAREDGTAWRELRSAHFAVQTDTEDPAALVRQLESVHARIAAVLAGVGIAPRPRPVAAVVFRSLEELREFGPPRAGAFVQEQPFGDLEVVFAFGREGSPVLDVAKQVARVHLLRAVPGQPRWFALGAPSYVASAAAVYPSVVDNPLRRPYRHARDAGIRIRDVLSDGPIPAGSWELAWVMVHYLADAHRDRLARALRRLPEARDPAGVFSEVFPEWSPSTEGGPERLERELDAYVAAPPSAKPLRVETGRPSFSSRAMPDAEVHAMRLHLPLAATEPREAAERARIAEATALLELAPAHPFALIRLALLRHEDLLPAARLAVDRNPRSAYAWSVLADALPLGSADRVAALRKALELAPEQPALLNNLAWDLFKQGRHDEALWQANRAVAAAPYHAASLDTQAAILADLGYCTDALAAERRAVEAVRDRDADRAARYRATAAGLETRCGGSSPPAAPAR